MSAGRGGDNVCKEVSVGGGLFYLRALTVCVTIVTGFAGCERLVLLGFIYDRKLGGGEGLLCTPQMFGHTHFCCPHP